MATIQQAKELYLQTKIAQLKAIYKAAQTKLTRKLASLSITAFEKQRAETLLKEIQVIILGLNKDSYAWSKSAMPTSYYRGIDFAADQLKDLNVTRFVSYDAKIHTDAVSVLIDDVAVDLITANQSMNKFFTHFIRQTQQRVIEDVQISKTIAQGVATGETRRVVSDNILKSLRAKMDAEQFIVINGRNYQPDKYAELLARTRTREATSQGTINTALRYGVDLVQWDAHYEICDYCAQYAGRVYSISGQDPSFPALTEKPPLHPNCRCIIEPVTREGLERRGYLQEIIDLSNKPLTKVDSFDRFSQLVGAR